MSDIELSEWGDPVTVALTEDERRALRPLIDRLTIRELANGSTEIGPRDGYVGTVVLSPDRAVVVRPKVPIHNVLALTSLAYRTKRPPRELGEAAVVSASPTDWLAVLLIAEIEALIAAGLRRGYIELEERIPYVRGRIRFDLSLRRWPDLSQIDCEFEDFVSDTVENRILRGTLEFLMVNRLHDEVAYRAREVLGLFTEVAYVRPSLRMFDRLRLSRLNRHYTPALELCRLILEAGGVDVDLGEVRTRAFFFPMEQVFEAAVANYLRDWLPTLKVQPQYSQLVDHVAGAPVRTVTLKPDLALHQEDRTVLVMDTKYKRPEIRGEHGGLSFRNNDIYQAVTYATALGCPAVLIYPEVDARCEVRYRVGGVDFSIISVNLDQPSLAGLDGLISTLESRGFSSRGAQRAKGCELLSDATLGC